MRTKYYYFFLMIFFSLAVNAQVKTIKVRKESAVCDFELIADSSLLGRKTRLAMYSFRGLKKRQVDEIRGVLRYVRSKPLTIMHDSIIPNIPEICDLKKQKLKSIEVVKSDEKPLIDIYGDTYYYVIVHFNYVNKPKKQ